MTDTQSCPRCTVAYPATTEFFYARKGGQGLGAYCKPCQNRCAAEWRAKNKDRAKANMLNWRASNPDRVRESRLAYERANADLVKERQQRAVKRLKWTVLCAYSDGKPACVCCGIAYYEFLTIDHIHGGGHQHAKELSEMGARLYQHLKNEGFPPGYRVLCMNCNLAIGQHGRCPHEGSPIRPEDFMPHRCPIEGKKKRAAQKQAR